MVDPDERGHLHRRVPASGSALPLHRARTARSTCTRRSSQSCNVYFCELGERSASIGWPRSRASLGFGAPTGLGLNGEVPGLIPTEGLVQDGRAAFRSGCALNTAIGQG